MAERLQVIISGCHAGPNPSSGLGTARSLRLAYPNALLIGRDFSTAATGLHDASFDEVWLAPPWDESDLAVALRQLEVRLRSAWLISALDSEVRWLADRRHPRILVPPPASLADASKPQIRAATRLPLLQPAHIAFAVGERDVYAFCRQHGWQIWVKGPVHEAAFARSWAEVCTRRDELEARWGPEQLFLQAHVVGEEVSIAFAAFEGDLLGSAMLEKQLITEQGKAWGGQCTETPETLALALSETLRSLRWTGGGELECIRDRSGSLWLLEWNPRFPAWVHGATLSGRNLPAALIERATGVSPTGDVRPSAGFVRVVVEVPLHPDLPLPRPMPSLQGAGAQGKHPSGMPTLHHRLHAAMSRGTQAAPLPQPMALDLLEAAQTRRETPHRTLLPRVARERFALANQIAQHAGVRSAYSVKTNPHEELLRLAFDHGLMAEVISADEIEWATICGFSYAELVYNGPRPLRRVGPPLGAAFADDVDAFRQYLHAPPARIVGLRLRPPSVVSRFGAPIDDFGTFRAIIEAMRDAPAEQLLGISLHVASSEVGLEGWAALARDVTDFAAQLSALSGRTFSVLDFGGGFEPEDLNLAAERVLPELARDAREALGANVRMLIEPGKALAGPSYALLSRVVHVRGTGHDGREVVLDAGVNDAPQLRGSPHRLAVIRGGNVTPLDGGNDRLLGPLCMESDGIATGVALPADLAVGDLIAICDVGAYDASMAYRFGRGESRT